MSNIAVVLLVLTAAGVRRLWAGKGAGSTVVEEDCRSKEVIEESKKGQSNFLDNGTESDYWRDGEDEDMEIKNQDWDWHIKYAL